MLIAALGQYFFGITIFVSSLFLIMLVLVQRGRGGGLAGALGGPGGQSAFGTKAGDLFTRITIVVAASWIFLCASAVFFLKTKKFTTSGGKSNAAASGTVGGTDGESASGNLPLSGESSNGASMPNLDLSDSAPGNGTAEITDLPSLDLVPPQPATGAETTPSEGAPAETTPGEPANDAAGTTAPDSNAETSETPTASQPPATAPATESTTGDQ